MPHEFTVTWTEVAILLIPLLFIGVRYIFVELNIHKKTFAFFLHPIAILVVFVLATVNFVHF